MKSNMTMEQLSVINSKDKYISLNALAGSGKTSTLLSFIKNDNNKNKILYLVYNKSMATEFTNKIKKLGIKNTEIKTVHALAYKWYVSNFGKFELTNINMLYFLNEYKVKKEDVWFINFYYNRFVTSDFEKPMDMTLEQPNHIKYVKIFNKIWNDIIKNKIISHAIYLKLFQLSKPKLDNYDIILCDEFQDSNMCMINIITNNLEKKIIVVGDPYQNIMSFNFSVNGLKYLEKNYGFKQYNLTNSFRISNEVAKLSSDYLTYIYNEPIKFNGLRHTKIEYIDINTANPANQIVVLNRTRFDAIRYMITLLDYGFDKKKKIYFEGGIEKFGYNDLVNLKKFGCVYLNGVRYTITELRGLVNEGVEDIEIIKILTLSNILAKNEDILYNLKTYSTDNIYEASVIMQTSHSSKGAEYDNVIINYDYDDFKKILDRLEKDNLTEFEKANLVSEINLHYVMLTRATKRLYIGNFEKIFDCDK